MGVRDWFKNRGQKKKEKESTPEPKKPMEPMVEEKPEELPSENPTQETGEPIPKPAEEETKEPTQEPASKEAEETTLEPVAEETEKLAQEPPTERAEEPTAEPATEEKEELAPETPAQEPEETPEQGAASEPEELVPELPTPEAKEPSLEPAVGETEGLAPELPAKKTEKSIPAPSWKFAFRRSKKRKQEKKEKESVPEPGFLKLLILPITLAAMLLGLSIMPLFPQPLPAILAFLIAFLAYKKPRIGMPIGGLVIGLGLMYNLSKLNFIAMLGSTLNREAFVFVLLFLFTALPLIFHSRRAVLSIDLGIIAAILLFFSQTYFLAIPLIFTAVVLFKRVSFLSVVYYGLISVPLEIMQYLNLVLPIERWDWWVEPGTSPPVYVPLTQIFTNVQQSMLQFRLYDTSLVVSSISDQFTMEPPVMPHNVLEMVSHYFDSLPGILMFLFMVVGIVIAFVFFTRSFLSKSNIVSHAERLIPTLTATVGVALFFILAAGLQGPLAFRVDVTGGQMAIATFATLLFTLPAFLVDYAPKERATIDMIMEKAKELKNKLQIFEDELYEVKNNLPISCGPFEVKVMMVRDRLNDILAKASMRLEEASEIDKIFGEIDSLSKEIDNLMAELDVAVGEYQIFVNCEYSKWLGMFKDIGLETEFAAKAPFQQGAPMKERIDQIKGVLADGRAFANEIIKVAEQAYEVMRTFYDPTLAEKSQSVAFAQKKLEEKATPWIALDALFIAVTNWNKQYKVQISKSVEHLRNSLASVAALGTWNGNLQLILGDDYPKMMENAKKAENIEMDIEKGTIKIINIMTIKNVFQDALAIARDVLSVLYEKLRSGGETLELLAPSEDFLWEKKNDALMDRMASAMEMMSPSAEVKLSEVLQSLPKFLSYIDECVNTIALYNETEELLLNYPIAEMAVENLFREKQRISARDLPFEPKYAEEYLKLFHRQRYGEFSLDRTSMLLTKKTGVSH